MGTGRVRYWNRGGFTLRWWDGGEGPTVLFLHGGGLPLDAFRGFCRGLARTCRIVAPDIPGWGRSGTPPIGWDYADYAALFCRWMQETGIRPQMVVGYSFGGGIATAIAPRLPGVCRVVLLSPGVAGYRHRHGMLLPLVAAEICAAARFAVTARRTRAAAEVLYHFCTIFVRHPLTQYRTFRVLMRCLLRPLPAPKAAAPAPRPDTVVVRATEDRFFPVGGGTALAQAFPEATFEQTSGIHLWVLLEHQKALAILSRHIDRACA